LGEGITDGLRQAEAALETAFVEVVEKDPADAARFVAMLEEEVLVAPFLVLGVDVVAEGGECLSAAAVEVLHVLALAVVRRHVHAATEPPDVLFAVLAGHEAAHIHVRRRAVRIARVENQRDAHGFPRATGQLRTNSRG